MAIRAIEKVPGFSRIMKRASAHTQLVKRGRAFLAALDAIQNDPACLDFASLTRTREAFVSCLNEQEE